MPPAFHPDDRWFVRLVRQLDGKRVEFVVPVDYETFLRVWSLRV